MTPHTPTKPGDPPCLCELCEEVTRLMEIGKCLDFAGHEAEAAWFRTWFNRKNERITELESELAQYKEACGYPDAWRKAARSE